jgi:hypothetical protein
MIYLMMKQSSSIFDAIPSKPSMTHGINSQLNAHVDALGATTVDMTSGTVSSLGCAFSVKSMATPSHSVIDHTPYATPEDIAMSIPTITIIII